MISFQLRAYIEALERLDIAKTRARARDPNEWMDDETKRLIRTDVSSIDLDIAKMGMVTAIPRASRLATKLNTAATYGGILREIEELWNALDYDSHHQFFYHYPAKRVGFLLRADENWKIALKAFPSAQSEIMRGVDCYALGHNTACVFHMCRVAEIGLRIIARERGIKTVKRDVPIEWATWGQVFEKIEPELEAVRKKPNGPKKSAALAFYSTVLSDLRAIQNLYRDPTMHLHENYDDGQAQSAMHRVQELMTILASKLDENSMRAIAWSSWK